MARDEPRILRAEWCLSQARRVEVDKAIHLAPVSGLLGISFFGTDSPICRASWSNDQYVADILGVSGANAVKGC